MGCSSMTIHSSILLNVTLWFSKMALMIERPIFIYTMTAGLGDLVVLGTLASWIEQVLPGSDCFFLHRNNSHTYLWQKAGSPQRFYNIYSCSEMFTFVTRVRRLRREGRGVFGLQMAPGSVQGYLFLRLLQKLGLLDYVVDFNLVNADIVTAPKGNYILDHHVHQIIDLCRCANVHPPQRPILPFEVFGGVHTRDEKLCVGLHPWSRRGHEQAFVWQEEKWLELIKFLVRCPAVDKIVIFGKDKGFNSFKDKVHREVQSDKPNFCASNSVVELAESISKFNLLISVNTGVVHIAHALDIPMVILNGPSLDLWIPKGQKIISIRDKKAVFQAPDRAMPDIRFSRVGNIQVDQVIAAIEIQFAQICGQS